METQRRTIDCNLCGCDDASVVFEAGQAQASRVVKCNQCGLMYASPRDKLPEELKQVFRDTQIIASQNEIRLE